MRYVELVKRVDGQELVIVGYFEQEYIKHLQAEGYRQRQVNKHGILVA